MRLRHYCWLLVVLIAGPLSALSALAADVWYSDIYYSYRFASPKAACDFIASKNPSNRNHVLNRATGEYLFVCNWEYQIGQIWTPAGSPIRSSAGYPTCESGVLIDPNTGACTLPTVPLGQLCADQSGATSDNPKLSDGAGNCVPYFDADKPTACQYLANTQTVNQDLTIRQTIDPDTGQGTTPQTAVNDYGCEVSVVSSAECVQPPPTCADGICVSTPASCQVKVKLTGKVGAKPGADRPQDDTCVNPGDPACTPPKPVDEKQEKPCVYATRPDGTVACASEVWSRKDGTENCGTANGEWRCFKANDPKAEGRKVETTVKTESTADGGTKTTQTDVLTETLCGATKATCIVWSTSSSTTTVKNGAGQTTSETGTCTGKSCPSNTDPDADGDGFGDCAGGQCGEGSGGAGDWYEPTEDTYASVIGGFKDRMMGAPVVGGIDNFLTLNPSGSCPVYNIDVWVFKARLDQWCGNSINWEFIKAIIIAAAAMMAFRIAFL